MGMQINTNVSALNAYRNLSTTQNSLNGSLEKLSSGLRINRAADDAAGLTISEGLRSQISGLKVAARNAQDGISVVQTAEGALNQVHTILHRMRDLAVQAGNDSNSADARTAITNEAKSLTDEISRISSSTNFNGKNLLDGSAPSLTFQVGADGNSNSQIAVSLVNVSGIATALNSGSTSATGSSFAATLANLTTAAATFSSTANGVTTSVTTGTLSDTADGSATGFQSVKEYAAALNADSKFSAKFTASVTTDANGAGTGIVVAAKDGGTVSTATAPAAGLATGGSTGTAVTGVKFDTAANAQAAIVAIDAQISAVSTARSTLGAVQNRFQYAIDNVNVSVENLSASESRIRDTDMAQEMANYTKAQILQQAGVSMLAQANSAPQSVLKLLQ